MKKKNFLTIFAGYVRISPKLLWGLVFFAVILLLAVLAPVLSPYDPYYLSDDLLVAPPPAATCWAPPTWARTC